MPDCVLRAHVKPTPGWHEGRSGAPERGSARTRSWADSIARQSGRRPAATRPQRTRRAFGGRSERPGADLAELHRFRREIQRETPVVPAPS